MTSAPQSERRRRQDDAHMARRWSVDTAGQARGRIKVVAFRCVVSVVDVLRAMLKRGFPEHGAES